MCIGFLSDFGFGLDFGLGIGSVSLKSKSKYKISGSVNWVSDRVFIESNYLC